MASVFDGIDMSQPCLVWPKLQEVYDRLIAGENVVVARFGTDEKRWQGADKAALKARITELRAECDRAQGRRPRRHAIVAGWHRV